MTTKSLAMANQRLNDAIAGMLDREAGSWSVSVNGSVPKNKADSSVLFLGDVVLAGKACERIVGEGPDAVFAHCPKGFFDADVICFNLECCLTNAGELVEPKPVSLVGDGRNLSAVPHPDRCVASVANNHFLDRGVVGAADTIEALKSAGIATIGSVVDGVAVQPEIRETTGGSIGFLAFSACAHRLSDDARVNVVRHRADEICKAVASAKSQADVLAVVLHQGVEYCPYPHPDDRRLCQRIAAAGADLIIAHHPHVVQGVEAFGDCIVFHSVGNFLFDPMDVYRPENTWTVAVRARLSNGSLCSVAMEPFVLNKDSLPEPMKTNAAREFGEHLRRLSLDLHDEQSARRHTKIAQRARLKERLDSAFCMLRRVGVTRTAQYYWGRLSSR